MTGRHSATSWRRWSRISCRKGRRPRACWLCSRLRTSWTPACLPCIPLRRREAWRRSTWVSREEKECVPLFDLGPATTVGLGTEWLGLGAWSGGGACHSCLSSKLERPGNVTNISVPPFGAWADWSWKKQLFRTSLVTPPCEQVSIAYHLTLKAEACAVFDRLREAMPSTPASGWAWWGDRWWRAALTQSSTGTLIVSLAFIKVGQQIAN